MALSSEKAGREVEEAGFQANFEEAEEMKIVDFRMTNWVG